MARQRFSDEDDDRDDDRPRRSRRDDDDDGYEDEREERPRRRSRRDDEYEDEYDDRRTPASKPGLAVAAGVMWCITGGIAAILSIFALIGLFALAGAAGAVGGRGLTPANILGLLMIFGVAVFCLIAAIRTLAGNVRSIRGFGIGSIAFFGGYLVLDCVNLLVLTDVPPQLRGGVMGIIVGVLLIHFLLLGVGLLMPGIFALSCATKYETWWRRAKSRRYDR